MKKNILILTVITKKGKKSITVKNFPMYIGKGKGKNIVQVPDDSLSGKHGVFFVEDDQLFYQDNSETGTRINAKSVRKTKVKVPLGKSTFQIGRYKVLVDNRFEEKTANKKTVGVSVIAGILVLLLIYFVYNFFSSNSSRSANNVTVNSVTQTEAEKRVPEINSSPMKGYSLTFFISNLKNDDKILLFKKGSVTDSFIVNGAVNATKIGGQIKIEDFDSGNLTFTIINAKNLTAIQILDKNNEVIGEKNIDINTDTKNTVRENIPLRKNHSRNKINNRELHTNEISVTQVGKFFTIKSIKRIKLVKFGKGTKLNKCENAHIIDIYKNKSITIFYEKGGKKYKYTINNLSDWVE